MRRLREASAPAPPTAAPAGSARPPASSAGARRGIGAERPLLPPGIDEVFLAGAREGATYAPTFFAEARLHYVAARSGIDVWEDLRAAVPFADGAPSFGAIRILQSTKRSAPSPRPARASRRCPKAP